MDGRIDHHWILIRINRCNFLIHLKEVAVFFGNYVFSVSVYGIFEIQINSKTCFSYAFAHIALFFGISRSNISGNKVTKTRIFVFQIIVPF